MSREANGISLQGARCESSHAISSSTRLKFISSERRNLAQALHVAKVMLRGPTDSTFSVAVFDGSILATAAVSAPDAMIKTVGTALDRFRDLPDHDREMLFETFRVW